MGHCISRCTGKKYKVTGNENNNNRCNFSIFLKTLLIYFYNEYNFITLIINDNILNEIFIEKRIKLLLKNLTKFIKI